MKPTNPNVHTYDNEDQNQSYERRESECKVCSVKCRVYSVKCAVSSVECKVWSAECKVWSVKCKCGV